MNNFSDLGKLVLRLTLGILLLFHGVSKIRHGVDFIFPALEAHGLPTALAYLSYIGEVLAPILLIVGLWSRLARAGGDDKYAVGIGLDAHGAVWRSGEVGRLGAGVAGLLSVYGTGDHLARCRASERGR